MNLITFLTPLVTRRELIWTLARRDLAGRYAGSLFGMIWTVIHPVVMIGIYWFVFGVGFKTQPMMNMPFVVWLTAGMLPWLLFTEIISTVNNSIVESAGLIKKTVFPSQIVVFSKILAALASHLVLLTLLFILMWAHGIHFSIFILQIPFYLLGILVLATGIGWTVSALNVFTRDVSQFVGVLIQIWFWLTPIFWNLSMMPPKVQRYLEINPLFYIVEGYRGSLLYSIPISQQPEKGILFWSFAGAFFIIGSLVFRRLQPHFGDVL